MNDKNQSSLKDSSSFFMLNDCLLMLEAKSQIRGERGGGRNGEILKKEDRKKERGREGGSKSRFAVLPSQLRH